MGNPVMLGPFWVDLIVENSQMITNALTVLYDPCKQKSPDANCRSPSSELPSSQPFKGQPFHHHIMVNLCGKPKGHAFHMRASIAVVGSL